MALNYVKDRYAEQKDPEDVVILCCVIKPLVSWSCERVATICRERCGGQGYLSINRLGQAMSFAHAAMTAEGDNRVLMQKVSKEVLARIQNCKHRYPQLPISSSGLNKPISSFSLEDLLRLFVGREEHAFTLLNQHLQEKFGSGKPLFQVWMGEESDEIQRAARVYGERITLEQFIKTLDSVTDKTLQTILTAIAKLFAFKSIEDDLSEILVAKLLSLEDGQLVAQQIRHLCTVLSPHVLHLVSAFGIPDRVLMAPIALNWVRYNDDDNNGEVINDEYLK